MHVIIGESSASPGKKYFMISKEVHSNIFSRKGSYKEG